MFYKFAKGNARNIAIAIIFQVMFFFAFLHESFERWSSAPAVGTTHL